MKLNTKLLIMAALIGIPLAVIAVVFILMTQRSLERKIRDSHMDLATHLAERTDAFSEDYERYITTFIYNYGRDTAEAQSATSATDIPSPEEQLLPLLPQFEHFRIMTVVGANGAVQAHVTAGDTISPADIAAHVAQIPLEQVIVDGKPFRSAPYVAQNAKTLVRTVAFPFAGGERLLAVEISLQPLQDMIGEVQFSRNGNAFLVDESGHLIAHPDTSLALNRKSMAEIELIKKALKNPSAKVAEFQNDSDKKMLGAIHPIKNGGLVIVQEPARDAYYTADRMKNLAAMAVLASALFALLAGVFIARSILGPMNTLVHGTERLSSGDLDYTVPIKSRDEMGKLAGAFNHMTESLSKRDKAIAHINQIAKELTSILKRNTLAAAALDALQEIAHASMLGILIADRDSGRLRLFLRQNRTDATTPELPEHLDAASHRAMAQQQIINETNAAHGPFLALPLMFENEIKGAMIIASRENDEPFTNTDMDLLGIIASSLAISVQNIELIEDTVEKTRMEQELQTAELVQKTLFPKAPPEIPGLDLKGFIESASETGGDWYGFVHEPENQRVAIIIADVTGHGVPAALVTATTSSFFKTLEIFRSYSHKGARDKSANDMPGYRKGFDPLSPDFMLRCLNEIILRSTDGKLVMTLFASVYYYDEKRLVYANAGHNFPIIHRPGGLPTKKKKKKNIGFLINKGMRLGDEPDVTFKEKEIVLEQGDAILWYTDGLIECCNPEGEEYSEARLKTMFEEVATSDADTIYNTILNQANAFYADEPHVDDITFVVGKCVASDIARDTGPAIATTTDLGIRHALIVSEDKRFSKQLSWFLTGHGADVVHHQTAAETLMQGTDHQPDLCILPLGGGLEQISLITLIKEKNPQTHFLFITSVPFDTMIPVLLELELPMHMIHTHSPNLLSAVQTAAAKLCADPFWGIGQYLARGTQVHSLKIRNTATRMQDAASLLDFARKVGLDDHTCNTLANITDELLMNAMFDAPRDKKGHAKYASLERTQEVKLDELESPVLEFGSDGRFLAVSVTDPFGCLSCATVLAYLEKCLFSNDRQIDDKQGGAGLGLFEIFRAADGLVFNVQSGRRTEVICLMKLKIDVKFTKRAIETLCFFERTSQHDDQ